MSNTPKQNRFRQFALDLYARKKRRENEKNREEGSEHFFLEDLVALKIRTERKLLKGLDALTQKEFEHLLLLLLGEFAPSALYKVTHKTIPTDGYDFVVGDQGLPWWYDVTVVVNPDSFSLDIFYFVGGERPVEFS